jgi:cytochrome c oxidase cbb3-type subunit 3
MRLVFFFFLTAFLSAQEPQAPPPAAAPKPATTAPDPQAQFRKMIRNFMALAPEPDAAAVDRGQQIFVASCAFCHGSNANGGNSGPDLVRSVLVLHDEGSGTQIGPVILNGRIDKGMPKFSMTPEQIKDIAAFLLSRNQAAANRSEYKIQNVVTGDPKTGEAYFGAHCASCHTAAGDLAHIAAKYDPVALQSRFLYPETRRYPGMGGPPPDPRGVTTVNVTLPSGEKFSGTLAQIDDFKVGLVDSTGAYHSWPLEDGNGTHVEIHDPLKGHEELLKQYTDADMHNLLAYLETLK